MSRPVQNLVFVTIDDLFSLSAWPVYSDIAITPNLDAFLGSSAQFSAAFADVAVCNPSRAAMLTGRTPWETGVISNKQALGDHVDVRTETLPGLLKAAGFHTAIGGKVFHDFRGEDQVVTSHEVLSSDGLRYARPEDADAVGLIKFGVTDQVLADDTLADSAAAFLERHDPDTPFALFLGIFRPHIDWVVPQEYLDLYANVSIPVPTFVDNQERAAFTQAMRLDFHNQVVASGEWEALIRHYLASVSYADARLGEILDALAASAHGGNTITMVTADHGYHLGDASLWHKNTTYDQSAQVPLGISLPGGAASQIGAPVNLSALAATTLELLNVDVPANMQPSLVPLLTGQAPSGSEYAVTWMQASVSIRTAQYRYALYENGEEELYDVQADVMNQTNLRNLRPDVLAELRAIAQQEIGTDLFIRPDGPVHGTDADSYYYLWRTPVSITDDGGRDRVVAAMDYTLPEGIEDLEALGVTEGFRLGGNAGDNYLSGTQWHDVIDGFDGDDTLLGEYGDDLIRGGAGDDQVLAGFGNDTVFGGPGADVIDVREGNDIAHGGHGDDRILGDVGTDLLRGEGGNDWLDGGVHNDRIEGGEGRDTLIGGHGWDYLIGGAGVDLAIFSGQRGDYIIVGGTRTSFRIEGPDGRDLLESIERLHFDDLLMTADEVFQPGDDLALNGGSGADLIVSHAGRDRLSGGAGNDRLHGRSNDDHLHGGFGDDLLDGGYGMDIASYEGASGAVTVSLAAGVAAGAFGNDTLIGIEAVAGGAFDDVLTGDAQDNTFWGFRGDDRIYAGAGDDLLEAGYGDDRVFGGEGNDRIYGANGRDLLYGGPGDDLIMGQMHDDTIHGGEGADLLWGNLGNDVIAAEAGDDVARGGFGHDTLSGGAGDDRLFGDEGPDRLEGGAGNDALHGGRGGGAADGFADVFVFGTLARGGGGADRIHDFENGRDRLDLTDFGFTSFALDILPRVRADAAGTGTQLDFGPGHLVVIERLALASFDASDVIL